MPHIHDLRIRDPFILTLNGVYYLYASRFPSFVVYTSMDLENWSEPKVIFTRPENFWATKDFWAPECHAYTTPDGVERYYLFASFKSKTACRGTQILVSDTPDGTFVPLTPEPLTPRDWECLDGTLYVEDGVPYMVFCHEWLQAVDGTICAMPLSADLTTAVGEPIELFHASDAPWCREVREGGYYITDGPFLYRSKTNELLMLWSSFGDMGYTETVCRSASGKIAGPWIQEEVPLMPNDGGHGMLFRDLSGALRLVLHSPNCNPNERAKYYYVEDHGSTLTLFNN